MPIEDRAIVNGETISREVASHRAEEYARNVISEASARNIDAGELFVAFAGLTAREHPNLAGKLLVALDGIVSSRLIVPAVRKENGREKSAPKS